MESDIINLFLSSDLPECIKVGNKYYSTRKFIEILEDITEKKIISKREERIVKHMINNTLKVKVIKDNPLKIIGKSGELIPILPSW